MSDESRKLAAKDWEPFFRRVAALAEELADRSGNKARTIKIGQFLSPNVNRSVDIQVNGRIGTAVLRVEEGRSKTKRYYFEVTWDDDSPITTKASKTNPPAAAQKKTVAPTGNQSRRPQPETKGATKSAKPGGSPRSRLDGGNDEVWE